MTKRAFLMTALLAALAFTAAAADITGKWTAEVPGRGGQTREQTFTFKADGATLTGSVTGFQGQDNPISDGKIAGDKISFVVKIQTQNGDLEQKFTGTVAGDEIKMEREFSFGGNPPMKQEFTAKRAK